MSSTSEDVCELWNGETIVRTLGSPYIVEIVYLEKDSPSTDEEVENNESHTLGPSDPLLSDITYMVLSLDGTMKDIASFGGVFSVIEATAAKLIKTSGKGILETGLSTATAHAQEVYELEAIPATLSGTTFISDTSSEQSEVASLIPKPPKPRARAGIGPPNLSLNVSGDPASHIELVLIALYATILQSGVIAFQILITYLYPFNESFTKNGRLAANYACPLAVSGASLVVAGMFMCSMIVQKRSGEEEWQLQRPDFIPGYRLKIAWLQRHQIVTDQNFGGFCIYAPPERRKFISSRFRAKSRSQNAWVISGTIISVTGFVLQFTGLRGMHYSATLAQLGATLLVSFLRVVVRRQLGNRPLLEPVPDGQELDWMARKTSGCSKWAVKPLSPGDPPPGGDLGTFVSRCRLRSICPWPLENSSISSLAEGLARSVEEITNYLYSSNVELKDSAKTLAKFEFAIHVAYSTIGSTESQRASIAVEMHRDIMADERSSAWTSWKIDTNALEAILALWDLNIGEDDKGPDTTFNERAKSLMLFNGQTTAFRSSDATSANTILRMNNSNLDSILEILHSNGVPGTREDFLIALVPSLQANDNLLRISDALSNIIQEAKEAEASGQRPKISRETLFSMCEDAVKTFCRSGHWVYAGEFAFGFLGTCTRILSADHVWCQTARELAIRTCHAIEARLFCEIEFRNARELSSLLVICHDLALRSEEVFGKESPESKMLRGLYQKAHFKSLLETGPSVIAELGDTAISRGGHAAQDNTAGPLPRPTADDAGGRDNAEGTSGRRSRPDKTVISELCALKPHLDFSFIEVFPRPLWILVKSQSLPAIYNNLLKPVYGQSATAEQTLLIANTFVVASACGYPRVVQLCLAKFEQICCRPTLAAGRSFSKALVFATMNKDDIIVDLILSSLGANDKKLLEDVDPLEGLNCLQIACRDGATNIASLLLQSSMSPMGPIQHIYQHSPLHLAIEGNHHNIVSQLLFHGVLPGSQDDKGRTILHLAIEAGAEDVVSVLLNHDTSNLKICLLKDYDAKSALDLSIIRGRDAIAIRFLEGLIAQPSHDGLYLVDAVLKEAFQLAIQYDRLLVAEMLLNNGMDSRKPSDSGSYASEIAACYGSIEVGRLLLRIDKEATISGLEGRNSPILIASENRRVEYVHFLIENGASTEVRQSYRKYTPALIAARDGNHRLLHRLLTSGADAYVKDEFGCTLMHAAALADSVECLREILETAPNSNMEVLLRDQTQGWNQKNPFQIALWRGKFAAATFLLERILVYDRSMLDFYFKNKMNALHMITSLFLFDIFDIEKDVPISYSPSIKRYSKLDKTILDINDRFDERFDPWGALGEGATELLELILQQDLVDVNALDEDRSTPLFYAVAGEQIEMCKLLLEHQASVGSSVWAKSPLEVALYTGNIGIIKLLITTEMDLNKPLPVSRRTPLAQLLHLAAETRKSVQHSFLPEDFLMYGAGPWESDVELMECFDIFIAANAPIAPTPEQLSDEMSLLHLAIPCKSSELLDRLVAAGADPNLGSRARRSLIHFALAQTPPYIDAIPVLLRHGVDINAPDQNGTSALTRELRGKKAAAVQTLLGNGASVRISGSGPLDLHLVIEHFGYPMVREFLKTCKNRASSMDGYFALLNGASADTGMTAVHVAARGRKNETLELLISEGADITAKTVEGYNALRYAINDAATLDILVKHGLGINDKQGDSGYTTAHLAVLMSELENLADIIVALWYLGADFNIKSNTDRTPFELAIVLNSSPLGRLNKSPAVWAVVNAHFEGARKPDGSFPVLSSGRPLRPKLSFESLSTVPESQPGGLDGGALALLSDDQPSTSQQGGISSTALALSPDRKSITSQPDYPNSTAFALAVPFDEELSKSQSGDLDGGASALLPNEKQSTPQPESAGDGTALVLASVDQLSTSQLGGVASTVLALPPPEPSSTLQALDVGSTVLALPPPEPTLQLGDSEDMASRQPSSLE
ncbi:Ankyrin-1 [Dactylella cylindrospora]|nr:Ankyrin-1 [Dactylella cylindrospora]